MDPSKIKTIQEWATPKWVKDVQLFRGFANFYQWFIKGFSIIVQPLIELTRKGMSFQWTPSAQHAFDLLKEVFTSALVLLHVDPAKPFQVETDGSDFAR